ncbi:MAG: MATE family efflux transporter [Candidatus Cloacimonetes bacterium]|nr:MATE family efflux transporter [Candidatus Cloacimonadota bacterium]
MEEITAGLDLTQGSHIKNLLKLSVPIMISNFMQTFYNLADTFWLGKLGEGARNAVSIAGIAFPIVFFFASFGMGLSIAGVAMISRFRGAGEHTKIREVTGQFMLVFSVISLLFILISLSSLNFLLELLQTPPEVFELARNYMQVTIIGIFFMFFFLAYQSFNHGLGDTVTPMKIQIITLTLNVIIDPFLIFGWWIFPSYGAMGAAYATFFCRLLTALLCIIYFTKKTPQFIPHRRELIPNFDYIRAILKIGLPASISQSLISFGFLILQGFVNSYGTVVISVNAIGNRMVSMFMMPAMGLSHGLAAIVGQNLGANNIKRVYRSIKHTFSLVMMIMISGGILMFLFGAELTRFFINDPEVIEVGRRMFRIIAVASNFFGVLFVLMGVFNGSGQTMSAMMFNLVRFWALRVPMVYLLSGKLMELPFLQRGFFKDFLNKLSSPLADNPYDALWWSMLFSNILAATLALIIYKQGKWEKAKIDK